MKKSEQMLAEITSTQARYSEIAGEPVTIEVVDGTLYALCTARAARRLFTADEFAACRPVAHTTYQAGA